MINSLLVPSLLLFLCLGHFPGTKVKGTMDSPLSHTHTHARMCIHTRRDLLICKHWTERTKGKWFLLRAREGQRKNRRQVEWFFFPGSLIPALPVSPVISRCFPSLHLLNNSSGASGCQTIDFGDGGGALKYAKTLRVWKSIFVVWGHCIQKATAGRGTSTFNEESWSRAGSRSRFVH